MNWTFNENPKKDGEYLLASFSYGSGSPYSVGYIGYTTAGGWNTHWYGSELKADSGFGFKPAATWAWVTPSDVTTDLKEAMDAKKESRPEAQG